MLNNPLPAVQSLAFGLLVNYVEASMPTAVCLYNSMLFMFQRPKTI